MQQTGAVAAFEAGLGCLEAEQAAHLTGEDDRGTNRAEQHQLQSRWVHGCVELTVVLAAARGADARVVGVC